MRTTRLAAAASILVPALTTILFAPSLLGHGSQELC